MYIMDITFAFTGVFPIEDTIACSARGRYVIIQIPGLAVLTLCEVEVLGYGKVYSFTYTFIVLLLSLFIYRTCSLENSPEYMQSLVSTLQLVSLQTTQSKQKKSTHTHLC